MTTRRTSHRRSSGSIRRLSSGSWQARYTGPDGALRSVGAFPTKAEADQAPDVVVSTFNRGYRPVVFVTRKVLLELVPIGPQQTTLSQFRSTFQFTDTTSRYPAAKARGYPPSVMSWS